MARIVKKPGDVFAFPTEGRNHGYCQWLPHDVRFFATSTAEELSLDAILALPVAFRIWVFSDTPSRYDWRKVGTAPVPKDCEHPRVYVKQDPITKKITAYRDELESRDELPATADEIAHCETAAVWAHPHIVERLLTVLAGVPSKVVESLRVKPKQNQSPDTTRGK